MKNGILKVFFCLPKFVLKKLNEEVKKFKKQYKRNPKIAILGISFKPDVDDIRESPSLDIAMTTIKKYKGEVNVFDPFQKDNKTIDICKEKDIFKSDLFLFLVNHSYFQNSKYKKIFKTKISLDFCNFSNS